MATGNLLEKKQQYNDGVMAPQHICVFGDPFTGKTRLIGQLAKKFHLIYFDLENGISTLMQFPDEVLANITYIRIKDEMPNAPRAHATIDRIVYGGDFRICEAHGSIDCKFCSTDTHIPISIPKVITPEGLQTIVVIDSASQLTTSINTTVHLLNKVPIDIDKLPNKENFDEWGQQWKFLNKIFTTIQIAPFHVIVTAHCEETKNEQGNKQLTPSIGTNNYSSKVGRFFNHIVYCGKQNGKHICMSSTTDSNFIQCGSHMDISIKNMVEPSLLPFFDGSKPEMIEVEVPNKSIPTMQGSNKTNASNILLAAQSKLKLPGK